MRKPFTIGIAGSSGSGKTFFLNSFLRHFATGEITLISQDDYYIPANTKTKQENRLYNFDLPTAIDREAFHRDVTDLFNGKTIYRQEYTFNNPEIKPEILAISPAPILMVEGLFIFHYEEINALLDYKIFIDADEDIALGRRLKRDLVERGYDHDDVMYKWVNHVVPCFQTYLLPYKSLCDLIIHNNTDEPDMIETYTKDIVSSLSLKFKANYF